MNVIKIIGTNIKGRNFEYDLPPACVLHGNNYTGKSAVVIGLRLGLAGYLPAPIGKLSSSIYGAIAGNPEEPGVMSVEIIATTKSGRSNLSYSSSWVRNQKGTVSANGGVPPEYTIPPILVDPQIFFASTGPERMKVIFDACDVKIPHSSISATLSSCAPGAFPVSRRMETLEWAIDRSSVLMGSRSNPQDAINSLIEELKNRLKFAKDSLKTNAGIIQSLNWQGEIPRDVSVLLQEALEKQARVSGLKLKAKAEVDQYEKLKKAKDSAAITREKINERIVLATWDEAPKAPDISFLRELKDELQSRKERNQDRANKYRDMEEIRKGIESKLEALEKNEVCPLCGSGINVETIRENLKIVLDGLPVLPEPIETESITTRISKIEAEVARYGTLKASYEADTSYVEMAKKLLVEIDKMANESIGDPPNPAAMEQLDADIEKSNSAVSLLHEASVKCEVYQQTNEKRDQLEKDRVLMMCDEATCDAAVKALRTLMADVVEIAFGKVLGYARNFTAGILNSDLEYTTELGRRVSDLDREMGCTAPIGSWISHESFSGTETAVAYAAFSVAIAMKSQFRIVIIDEIGRMSSGIKDLVLERIKMLVETNLIDQFIGIDTVPTGIMESIEVGGKAVVL